MESGSPGSRVSAPSSSSRSIPKKASVSSFGSNHGPTNLAGVSALAAPRASSSSSRPSIKKPQIDFEAALLNPNATIYLSGSPNMENRQDLPQVKDEQRPSPAEKRSYEDDLRALSQRTPAGRDSISPRDDEEIMETSKVSTDLPPGAVVTSTVSPMPSNLHSPQVIPPTPSSTASTYINRRGSQMTMQSQDSGGSPSSNRIAEARRRTGPSLGLDAELKESRTLKKPPTSKRRSIFQRSPGTASSPDLATLVKKAKEKPNGSVVAAAQKPLPVSPQRTPSKSTVASTSNRVVSQPSVTPSQSTGSQLSTLSGREYSSRNSANGTDDGWEKFSAGELSSAPSRDRMPSIAEQSQRISDDNPKTLRNKARGVFGKMFGGSTSREATPHTSPAQPSKFAPQPDYPRPPVPPIPANYQVDPKRRPPPNPPTEPVGLQSPASIVQAERTTRPVTPVRRASDSTSLGLDKPLPAVQTDSAGEPSGSSYKMSNGRHTLHIRQPADDYEHEEESHSASPGRTSTEQFSKDVAGIFDTIAQTDPARELGLPPDSLREDPRSSMETARGSSRKIPMDLGRRSPVSPAAAVLATPPVNRPVLKTDLNFKTIPNRASSLPPSSPAAADLPTSPEINLLVSKRSRSPRPHAEDVLVPPLRTVSRSSSTSSKRRRQAVNVTDLSSPLMPPVPLGEATPSPTPESDSARQRRSSELSVLTPVSASVRLVKSPRLDEPSSAVEESGVFRSSSPWGKASPTRNVSGSSSSVNPETDVEDDEEKGRRLACEVLDNDYSSMASDKVAMFLGGTRPLNRFALRSYMSYFDMRGQSLVDAFRQLCAKLYLRAESQEIDRILEAFSRRYYECNPTTVFGTPGVVHTVTGAMLMLNTDLHIAELSKHMSRNDFIRNTLRTIRESAPLNDRSSTPILVRDDSGSLVAGSVTSFVPSPKAGVPSAHRSASAPVVNHPPSRTESERSVTVSTMEAKLRAASASTATLGNGSFSKAWETDTEMALRDIYTQVRADRILLPTADFTDNRQSVMSTSTIGSEAGRRLAKTTRNDPRLNALKRGSIRSVQGMNYPYGSNFSASDGRLSPTPSYATSFNDSTTGGFTATIGFASNLSHAVIKEQEDETRSVDSQVSMSTAEDLNDDELALFGAPWAKEGMLWKRNGEDNAVKKTTKKEWKQFFVVVQQGELLFFTFGAGSGSTSLGSVGGGNWLSNANNVGRYSLVHTLATNMPGGYSRDFPYTFRLTLHNNSTLFLAAGTDDLVTEWVQTCRYWAARRSRPALQGGVSNIEYGWARAESGGAREDDRASVRSGRSNMSKLGSQRWNQSMPSDRIFINDWKPPPPNLLVSQLDEENQLESLAAYIKTLTDELDTHRVLEEPMMRLYSPGSKNAMKAHSNFHLKAKYLVSEIKRYEEYIISLQSAISLRIQKQGEKKLEKSLARSTTSLHRAESEGDMLNKYMDPARRDDEEAYGSGTLRNGDATITRNLKGLAIDVRDGGDDGGEGDGPRTPVGRMRQVS